MKNELNKPENEKEREACFVIGNYIGKEIRIDKEKEYALSQTNDEIDIYFNPFYDATDALELMNLFNFSITPNDNRINIKDARWLAVVNGVHAIPGPTIQFAITFAAYAIATGQIDLTKKNKSELYVPDKKIVLAK